MKFDKKEQHEVFCVDFIIEGSTERKTSVLRLTVTYD